MALVRILPLGGVGEIGKNCTVVEQGDDIIVIDCGLAFPNEEMLGVDIVIPDFTYLIANRDKVRGVFLTHAHEDHVGSLSFLLQNLNVPVYATEFTHALIRNKLEERGHIKEYKLKVFKPGDIIEAGGLSVEPIRVTHSIPENCSMAVRTSQGIVLFTGDFKFDFTPVDGKLSNIARFGELGEEGVVLLLSDSTNIERPGWGPSESIVKEGLRKAFLEAPGRVLLTTFASNIHRMQQVIDVAGETGRRVGVVGRRMEQNLDICSRMGFLRAPTGVMARLDELRDMPANKVVMLTTGSQGEPMSALVQMSKSEYSRVRTQEGDTILYSARPIPGNEAAIWRTINRLFRLGAKVIYDSQHPVHVSGHAYAEELKMMINLTRPFYVAPVHGEPRHQYLYREMALGMGYPDHRIFTLTDGVPLVLDDTQAYLADPEHYGSVLVDNAGNVGITHDVLKDRTGLANHGVVAISLTLDTKAGSIKSAPQIEAKGFQAPDDLVLERAVELLSDHLRSLGREQLRDTGSLRNEIADVVKRFIYKKGSQKPLVIAMIQEV